MATTSDDAAPAPSAEPVLEEETTEEEKKISELAKALEEKIAAHGERAIEVAPAYVEYARVLLAKSQAESDPLGGAIKREDTEAVPGTSGGSGSAQTGDKEDDQEADEEDGEEGEEAAESDDLELAFQCLEVARLIYEEVRDVTPIDCRGTASTMQCDAVCRRPARRTSSSLGGCLRA